MKGIYQNYMGSCWMLSWEGTEDRLTLYMNNKC
jgi:hypothetical protein